MVLFLISFLFIFSSSYLFASIIQKYSQTKTKPVFVYWCLSAFTQIILSFELMSLFSAINKINFLCLNLFFLIVSVLIVKIKRIEIFKPDFKAFFRDINKAAQRDKMLYIGFFALMFFIVIAFILAVISPVSISDAMAYHVPRAVNWVINGSLSHFMTNDMRMNTMPINSELLFAWIIMYLKSDISLGFIAFLGYLNTIVVLYCLLGEIGFCVRKRLWTVFVFSGLAFVVIETPSCDTNMFAGTLVLSALYLFYCGLKYEKNTLLFISSLSLAIGCGVKTTVMIAGPAAALMLLCFSIFFRGKEFYKPMLKFSAFFLLNFLLFSSYNYILNYIDYNGFSSTAGQYEYHRFRGGIKGYLSSLIKYSFMLCDFSGISFAARFSAFFKYLLDALHLFIVGVPSETYASAWYPESDEPVNFLLLETTVGVGLTGLLAFFPSLLISVFRYKKPNKKHIIPLFAYMYIINLLLFIGIVFYTEYNSRYLTTFALISSPVLVCSYIKSYKNIYKWLVLIIACYYLMIASQRNPYRMISEIMSDFNSNHSIVSVRNNMRGSSVTFSEDELSVIRLRNYILKNKFKNIAFFSNDGDLLLPIDLLRLHGHKINYLSFENLDGVDLSDYDMIVVHTMFQKTDNIRKYNTDDTALNQGVKVYYDNKNDVTCYYVDYANKIIDKNSDGIPVYANCPIPIEMLDKSGYRVSAVFREDKYSPLTTNNPDNHDYAVYIKTGRQ